MGTVDTIKKQISDNSVLLYMKGVPSDPQCGYSKAAVEALAKAGIEHAYVDVLKSPFIRERLPEVSSWPTFPQLFVNGELVGGSDVICELVASGELQKQVEALGV